VPCAKSLAVDAGKLGKRYEQQSNVIKQAEYCFLARGKGDLVGNQAIFRIPQWAVAFGNRKCRILYTPIHLFTPLVLRSLSVERREQQKHIC